MTIQVKQNTVKTEASLHGHGLHTGEECEITLNPAQSDSGVVFITDKGEVPAHAAHVGHTMRGMTLRRGDAEVHTVEHLLAAFAGLEVDNVRVHVSGPEIPAADGSSLPFVELIEQAGITTQDAEARVMRLHQPVWVKSDDKYLIALPSDSFRIHALALFEHPLIGERAISLQICPDTFKREIAPARTFCTSDEVEYITSLGLGKGGRENNVIIVYKDCCSVPLRFEDEFVRHKVLDLIGDLSLVGGRLYADIVAVKSSHRLNSILAARICTYIDNGQVRRLDDAGS